MTKLEDFNKFHRRNIAQVGQSLLGVLPTAEDPPDALPFSYTIGNYEQGLPELLLVANLPSQTAGALLNEMGRRMRAAGRPYNDGERVSFGGKLLVKIIEAGGHAKKEYTIQVGRYYGIPDDEYRVQQVLMPDANGVFPDESGCQKPYSEQPVLREPAGRA
jgi:Domain of unknown function (DUF4262)